MCLYQPHKPIQRRAHGHSIPIPTYHDKRRRAHYTASCGYCFTRISCRRNSCGNAYLRFKVSSVRFKACVYRASIVLPLRRKPAGNVHYNQNTGHCVRYVTDMPRRVCRSLDYIADRACMVCRYQSGRYPMHTASRYHAGAAAHHIAVPDATPTA